MNLVSNGAEAMPEGGRITVSTTARHVELYTGAFESVEEGDYAVLEGFRHGSGHSRRRLGAGSSPSLQKNMGWSGTGLGMSVVWGTVKDHGGYLDIESDPGRGTTFTLYFPPSDKKIVQTSMVPPVKRAKRESRSSSSTTLRSRGPSWPRCSPRSGYSVETVPSGEEAISLLGRKSVDLLLLYMCMDPGMDGLNTGREVLKMGLPRDSLSRSG